MNTRFSKAKQVALGLTIAVAGATFAPMAQAKMVELVKQESSSFGTPKWARGVRYTLNGDVKIHQAGLFRLKDSATGDSVLAWCIDLLQELSLPATHDTTTSLSVNAAQLDNIDRLFTSSYSDVNDRNTAAGFQLALWEIMTDTGSASGLDLGAGGFQTNSNKLRYQLAGEYLGRIGTAGTGGYDITTYYSADSQNLVSVSPVPLPATALLLLSGLAGAGAMRSRRRKS